MIDERAIRERYEAIRDQLDERGRRLFAAAEARSVGRGGVMAVYRPKGVGKAPGQPAWRAAPSSGGWRISTSRHYLAGGSAGPEAGGGA